MREKKKKKKKERLNDGNNNGQATQARMAHASHLGQNLKIITMNCLAIIDLIITVTLLSSCLEMGVLCRATLIPTQWLGCKVEPGAVAKTDK